MKKRDEINTNIDVLEQYKRTLENDYRYSISKFDNQSLYISSGALALSLTFVKDIVPIEHSKFIVLYFVAISVFTFSILLSFVSHYWSSRLINNRIIEIERENFDVPEDKTIPTLNRITIILLSIGILSLVSFSIASLNHFKQTTATISLQSSSQDEVDNDIKTLYIDGDSIVVGDPE